MLSPGQYPPDSEVLQSYLSQRRRWVDDALSRYLSEFQLSSPVRLNEAIQHSLLHGGKRLRPILVLACAEAFGNRSERFLAFACALECIHTYSLIHDDLPAMDNDDLRLLPAMDNDDLRRGRPTCHKQFDEATAILAGDALLTLAFELAAQPMQDVVPTIALTVIGQLAQAAGMAGMVGGQMLDMLAENRDSALQELKTIHAHNTGALIRLACVAGAALGGANDAQKEQFGLYGEAIGLAFQITDDILDIIADKKKLGKKGSDLVNKKLTYISVYGIDKSYAIADEITRQGHKALTSLKNKNEELLHKLLDYVATRKY